MELKEIKREIDSVRNIWKLTGALETLSALKMKRAQKIALLSRPFSEKVAQILEEIDSCNMEGKSVFFEKRKGLPAGRQGNKVLALVLASDRGFCGAFNQNILRFVEKTIKEIKTPTSRGVGAPKSTPESALRSDVGAASVGEDKDVEILPVGKKAISYFKKKGYESAQNFFGIGDFGKLEDVKMISDFLVGGFLKNKYQEIYLFYTNFISTFLQKPKSIKLLPLDRSYLREFCRTDTKKAPEKEKDFLMEPSGEQLFKEIVPQLVEYLIYQAILEGNASEHSARMMAMRNASENAEEKVLELNLSYNRARQEQITAEVCEVSSAKEVLD
ncbi:MAG: FoF1 ATP synthase subunit gamma [Patescibacteria group bacterium]